MLSSVNRQRIATGEGDADAFRPINVGRCYRPGRCTHQSRRDATGVPLDDPPRATLLDSE
jgi:hypothetical protein